MKSGIIVMSDKNSSFLEVQAKRLHAREEIKISLMKEKCFISGLQLIPGYKGFGFKDIVHKRLAAYIHILSY